MHQPVVLVAAHSKVSIVGQVDNVSWPHIDRVPQGAVRATLDCQNVGWVAGNIALELLVVVEA